MKNINISTLVSAGENGYEIRRIPGIVCGKNGTLIAYYESRYGSSDWSVIDITLRRSTDNGKTWSNEYMLASGGGKNALNNPLMFADNGTFHAIWFENYKRAFYRISSDDGVTWSDSIEITDYFEEIRYKYDWSIMAGGPGHGTVLRDGALIAPVWLCSNNQLITAHHPSVVTTIRSTDHGKTWHMGDIIQSDDLLNPNESALAELSDGSIVINMRNESEIRQRCIAHSKDGLTNWHNLHFDETLVDPICEGGMCNFSNGILFTNCNSQTERTNLTIHKSIDDGNHWESHLIDNRSGYSDVCFNPVTKTAFVIYEVITELGVEGINLAEIEL